MINMRYYLDAYCKGCNRKRKINYRLYCRECYTHQQDALHSVLIEIQKLNEENGYIKS